MSVKISGKVWDMQLAPTQKLVALALADHADHDGGNIYPGVESIMNRTGLSERTVRYTLKQFKASGLLIAEQNENGGRGKPTVFRIDIRVQTPHPLPSVEKGAADAGERVQPSHPKEQKGCKPRPERVQTTAEKGASVALKGANDSSAYKEEPSGTVLDPSGEPSLEATPPVVSEMSPTDIAMAAYQSGFLQRFGSEPHIAWGKDNRIIKGMVQSYGLERALELIVEYLDSEDEFIVNGGYTIGILSVKLNSLIVQKGNGKARARLPARSKANLAAYEEAMRMGPPKR